MGWKFYSLDRVAQKLVLEAKARDRDSLNQSFKMRESVAYGLERFWGEHLRLEVKEKAKSQYWKATWDAFVRIMSEAKITIPNDSVSVDDTKAVTAMAEKLWTLALFCHFWSFERIYLVSANARLGFDPSLTKEG